MAAGNKDVAGVVFKMFSTPELVSRTDAATLDTALREFVFTEMARRDLHAPELNEMFLLLENSMKKNRTSPRATYGSMVRKLMQAGGMAAFANPMMDRKNKMGMASGMGMMYGGMQKEKATEAGHGDRQEGSQTSSADNPGLASYLVARNNMAIWPTAANEKRSALKVASGLLIPR